MGGGQALHHLPPKAHHFGKRERAVGEDLLQRRARHELHHDELAFGLGQEVVDRRDVGMTEARERSRLRHQLVRPRRRRIRDTATHLDSDVALEPFVAGPIHAAHSTDADEIDNRIARDRRAGQVVIVRGIHVTPSS
jgi:hypothetical protein